jgi:hypothetical protein
MKKFCAKKLCLERYIPDEFLAYMQGKAVNSSVLEPLMAVLVQVTPFLLISESKLRGYSQLCLAYPYSLQTDLKNTLQRRVRALSTESG